MNFKPTVRRPAKSSAGFTLVELLVVITIIAVLTAIGFPLAAKMRASAKRTQCMTQLRTWGVAIGGYMADHDGKVEWEHWPSIGNDPLSYSPYVSYWTGDSEDKSGFEAQLRQRCCPAVEWKKVAGGPNSPVTYAMIQPVGVKGVGITGRQKGESSDYAMSKVARPSRFMLMIDAASASSYSLSAPASFETRVKPITLEGADCRHNSSVNALFADFSVKSMYWPEVEKGLANWTTF